jgi:outer membrane immunogenic protein
MKRLLFASVAAAAFCAAPALAADVPVKASYVAPVFNWTGFYIGGHVGGALADDAIVDVNGLNGGAHYTLKNSDPKIWGGQIGYNIQNGQLVYGLEGDFGQLDLHGFMFDPHFPGGTFSQERPGFIADATGRVGWALGQMLVYAKGGWAYFNGRACVDNSRGGFGGGEACARYDSGWTLGGGLEVMLNPAWSLKAEWQYFDFGTKTATLVTPANGIFRYSNDLTVNAVTVGLNYKFGSR